MGEAGLGTKVNEGFLVSEGYIIIFYYIWFLWFLWEKKIGGMVVDVLGVTQSTFERPSAAVGTTAISPG